MSVQWPLVFFTLLMGTGLGLFFTVGITEWLSLLPSIRFLGALTALFLMAIGGFAGTLHLSYPSRAYHVFRHLSTGVGKEMLLVGLNALLILGYVIMVAFGFSESARKVVVLVAMILSALLAFELGAIYVLPARPAWNTWFWPFIYASSAAVTGLWAFSFLLVIKGPENKSLLLSVDGALIVALITKAMSLLACLIFLKGPV